MIERVEQELTPFTPAPLDHTSGNYWLTQTLRRWGVTGDAGVDAGDGCVVIDDIDSMEEQLERAQSVLLESKPVAICFYPEILSKPASVDVPSRDRSRGFRQQDVDRFVEEFPSTADGRRVVIYVSSEAARSPGMQAITTQLSELLQAPTVWPLNGANP